MKADGRKSAGFEFSSYFLDTILGLQRVRCATVPVLRELRKRTAMRIAMANGVLEMHCACVLRTDGMYSDNEMRAVLEKNL